MVADTKEFILKTLHYYESKKKASRTTRDFHAKTLYNGAIMALEEILTRHYGMVDTEIKTYLDSLNES